MVEELSTRGRILIGEAYGGPYRDMATQFLHHKVNLKLKIYPHVNPTTQRCSNKILKTSLIEDFFHLTPVLLTLVVHHKRRISLRFFENFEMGLLGYSGALGKQIREKT
jgi:hypothetical protein